MSCFCPLSKHPQYNSGRRSGWLWTVNTLTLMALCVATSGFAQAITRVPVINTIAGNGTAGYSGDGGAATSAELSSPYGVALDSAANLYIADAVNNRIREVALGTGVITTIAGNGTAGYSGDGGPAAGAALHSPAGVTVDAMGNLYIADQGNNVIRKVSATGTISTLAGNNEAGFSGDNGTATSATLYSPAAVAVDSTGNVYIADAGNKRIREVNTSGIIITLAGNGVAGYSGDNGPATSATLNTPSALTTGSGGTLYVADTTNNVIRQISATGTITTFAGNGSPGYSGDNGPATSATLNAPHGLNTDSSGNLYIADSNNDAIRMVTPGGVISTVAGNGTAGFGGDGSSISNALLDNPRAIAFDGQGNLYFSDQSNNRLREVSTPAGTVLFPTTAVNTISATVTIPLLVNAPGTTITGITSPVSLGGKQEYTVTATGCALNTVLDAGTLCNVTVTFTPAYPGPRPVPLQVNTSAGTFSFGLSGVGTAPQASLSPGIITTIASTLGGAFSSTSGVVLLYGPEASVGGGAVVDSAGNIYVGVETPEGFVSADAIAEFAAGTGIATSILEPTQDTGQFGLALDSADNVYAAAPVDNCVYKVAVGASAPTVVAGSCGGYDADTGGFSGDNGPAVAAKLNAPAAVAVDNAGNLYIADSANNRIRKVTAVSGIITTIAGVGTSGSGGDNGLAANAELNDPMAVALNSAGDLYIADYKNHRVRKITAATGIISTIAGNGTGGYGGDNGPATSAELDYPVSLAIDGAGDIYVADTASNTVRLVNTAGIISTVAGTGTAGGNGDGGPATSAVLDADGVALDGAGTLYITGYSVRTVDVSTSSLTFPTAQIGATTAQTVTVTDTGNSPLSFSVPGSGQNPSISTGFALDSTASCPQLSAGAQPASLAPGISCALVIDYAPSTAAAITGTATIADNSLGIASTQTVQLTGGAGQTVATTTTLNVATPIFGETAVSATIAATAGTLVPTGSVVFTVDGAAQAATSLNVSGMATLPAPVSNALAVGSHTIGAAYTSNSLGFSNSLATRIFSVSPVPPSVTIAASAASLSVAQGATVTDTITLTPVGGFTGALQFACQNLPANATCTFAPATVTLAGTPQTTVVTIQAAGTAAQVMRPHPSPQRKSPVEPEAALWAPLLAAFTFSKRRCSAKVRSPLRAAGLFAVLLVAASLAISCGGGSATGTTPPAPTPPAPVTPSPVTPAGTSTVQIVATASGSTVQTIALPLTVHD